MFVVAIVATLSAFLAVSQQVWLRQAQNLADLGQADGISRGAIQLAGVALVYDAKNTQIDTLAEEWNKPVVLPVEGGFVTIEVKDAQSRFNLNNLVTGAAGNRQVNPPEVSVFEQLLIELDLDVALKSALLDWLDGDSNVEPGGGAEDLDYINQSTPYRTANGPLESVDELKRIKGFTPDVIDKLREHVVALPTDNGIVSLNINTAEPATLAAVMRVSRSAIESAIGKDSARKFASTQDLDKLFPAPTSNNSPGTRNVVSNYFLVSVKVNVGRIPRSTEALIWRDNSNFTVHWQQPTPLKIVRDEPDA